MLRLQTESQDLTVRWLESAENLLPLVRIIGRSRHPALVLPTRMGMDPSGRAWVGRPYFEGAALDERCPPPGDPRWPKLACQWLEALDALHAGGWLHRDVKAGNLLVGPAGAKLFDLDLAVHGARVAVSAGTRRWLSPEVLAGKAADERSDLFGLGAALARALLGEGSARYTEDFPAADFWTATGLDPSGLPATLQGLAWIVHQIAPPARPNDPMAASDVGLRPPPASRAPVTDAHRAYGPASAPFGRLPCPGAVWTHWRRNLMNHPG